MLIVLQGSSQDCPQVQISSAIGTTDWGRILEGLYAKNHKPLVQRQREHRDPGVGLLWGAHPRSGLTKHAHTNTSHPG